MLKTGFPVFKVLLTPSMSVREGELVVEAVTAVKTDFLITLLITIDDSLNFLEML